MNYVRIYEAFIQDRRAKEAAITGYSERHHIVPKSLGGSNDPENLIDLIAEDHLFAHILLARIHGGKMKSALWRMMQSSFRHGQERIKARERYAIAQKIVAAYLKDAWAGKNNPLFNSKIIDWFNYRTRERKSATLFDMHCQYGGSRPQWTNVLKGSHPSIWGWMPASREGEHKHSEKGQVFRFINRDGRSFCGTQNELIRQFGVGPATACRIVRQASVSVCGWRLDGVKDRRPNAPKDGRSGANKGQGRKYTLRHRDGTTFSGTAAEFCEYLEKPVGFRMDVRLSQLHNGTAPSVYGWSIFDHGG